VNARERFLAVLAGEMPDRVPTFEILIHPRVIEALCPGADYARFVEEMDIEGAITGTPSSLYRKEVVDAGRRLLRDEWGVLRQEGPEIVPMPMGGPIQSLADLGSYRPPDPDAPWRLVQLEELVRRFRGKRAIGVHLHDSFSYPTYLMGMDKLLMALLLDPPLVEALVTLAVQHTMRLLERAAEIGADFVLFGDDYAATTGPLMSPRHFERYFLPGLGQIVQTAKALGLRVIKHTCGQIGPLLDMIVETGIDGLHPLDAAAGMDIAAVKARYAGRLTVCGGIDCGEVLSDWPPERVEQEVRRRLEELMPGGRYILCSSNSIHSRVRPENYAAMLRALRVYGVYA